MADDKQTLLLEMSLSPLEAALIAKVRKHPYGKITVYIQEGNPGRIIVEASEQLHEQDGFMIATKVRGQ